MSVDHSSEVWRDVEGHEGLYQVSNYGRLRRLPSSVMIGNRWGQIVARKYGERYLKPTASSGYMLGVCCDTKYGSTLSRSW